MTIAAAYLTSEGVVFGSDSTTTVIAGQQGVQILRHAQKIFALGEEGSARVAIGTYGAGMVGQLSHRTVAARIADGLGTQSTVLDAAQALSTLAASQPLQGPLGYFVGGWNPTTHEPQCYQLSFNPGQPPSITRLGIGGTFEGAPEMFKRAYHGIDERLAHIFVGEIKKQLGSAVPNLDAILTGAMQTALMQIPHGGLHDMPLREAIDFVHMYLHLTIKAFKFRFGVPICGGPIEIGFISTDRPFRWVRHKAFDSAVYEEEVGDGI